MCERITPPKIVPSALVSFGSKSTLIAGTRSGMAHSLSRPQKAQGGHPQKPQKPQKTQKTQKERSDSGLDTSHVELRTHFALRSSHFALVGVFFATIRVFFVYSDFLR